MTTAAKPAKDGAKPEKMTREQLADAYIKFGPDMANDVLDLLRTVKSPDHVIVRTGVAPMDNDITISGGSVTVVAARPSHGKSMMLKMLARSVMRDIMSRPVMAGSPRDAVIYVTLEEPSDKLYVEIGGHLPYSYRSIHRGEVPDDTREMVNVLQGVKVLGNLVTIEHPGLINGRMAPPITTDMIVHTIERLATTYNIRPRAIMLDYLQLLSANWQDNSRANRTDIVTAASNGVSALARAYRCPVIVAAQAARGVDDRKLKIPAMGDMQHASSIEQDAHTILGLWRPIIDGETTVMVGEHEISVTSKTMLVRVAKSRADGAGGKLYALNFDPVTLDCRWIDPSLENVGGRVYSEPAREWWES
jgi:replicative DNA helicase